MSGAGPLPNVNEVVPVRQELADHSAVTVAPDARLTALVGRWTGASPATAPNSSTESAARAGTACSSPGRT
jgi:hypothetical protein